LSIPNPGNNPPFYLESRWDPVTFGVPNPDVSKLSQGLPADAFVRPVAPALFSLDPGFRNPYVQHWNFSLQQSLGWNTVWEIVWKKVIRVPESESANAHRRRQHLDKFKTTSSLPRW
jgi:hypothetical protein